MSHFFSTRKSTDLQISKLEKEILKGEEEKQKFHMWTKEGATLDTIAKTAENTFNDLKLTICEKQNIIENLDEAIKGKEEYYNASVMGKIASIWNFFFETSPIESATEVLSNLRLELETIGRDVLEIRRIASYAVLNINKGKEILQRANSIATDAVKLQNQGIVKDLTKTAIFAHQQNMSSITKYGVEENQDAGAAGISFDERASFAVVADGISNHMKYRLNDRQDPTVAFANGVCYTTARVLQSHYNLFTSAKKNETLAISLFQECGKLDSVQGLPCNLPDPMHPDTPEYMIYGQSTCTFAIISRLNNKFMLNGACIGDSVVITISPSQQAARLITPLQRENARLSGGYLTPGDNPLSPQEHLFGFSEEIKEEDIVLLASDGLIDNIFNMDIECILPLIINSSTFDQSLQEDNLWQGSNEQDKTKGIYHLPSQTELTAFLQNKEKLNDSFVRDKEIILNRLQNYLQFVAKPFENLDEPSSEMKPPDMIRFYEEQKTKLIEGVTDNQFPKPDDTMIIALSPPPKLRGAF